MAVSVLQIVCEEIEVLNENLDYDSLQNPNESTPVFGGEDSIDSLSLVMLVTALETRISEEVGANLLLADEKAMSRSNSPYRTAGTLVEFIESELGDVT